MFRVTPTNFNHPSLGIEQMTTKDYAARTSQIIQEHQADIAAEWIAQLEALIVRGTSSSKEQLRSHCQQFLAAFATATRAGEIFVCEDLATEEIDIGVIERDRSVSRFLSVTGPEHAMSELTGVTFDPSGGRMYFSSQRAGSSGGIPGPGAIYEISGPFRGRRVNG